MKHNITDCEFSPVPPFFQDKIKVDNRRLLAALIYRCENGCSWRALPQSFGSWHVIYVRLNRWAKSGVLERVYIALSAGGLNATKIYALDSTAVKVHPDAHGGEKNGEQAIGKSRGGWNTKIHAVAASDRQIIGFLLSGGDAADAQAGRLLLETLGKQENTVDLLMDRAYEDDITRFTAWGLKFNPVVPPKKNRIKPWEYDSVNDFLKNICQVEHSRHRSIYNFLVNVLGLYRRIAFCRINRLFTVCLMRRLCLYLFNLFVELTFIS